jgi:hypothetical protein
MSSIRAFAVLFLLVLWGTAASGQGPIADSLEQILPQAAGRVKVDILNQLTYEYISRDNDKVVRYSNQALQLYMNIFPGNLRQLGKTFTWA